MPLFSGTENATLKLQPRAGQKPLTVSMLWATTPCNGRWMSTGRAGAFFCTSRTRCSTKLMAGMHLCLLSRTAAANRGIGVSVKRIADLSSDLGSEWTAKESDERPLKLCNLTLVSQCATYQAELWPSHSGQSMTPPNNPQSQLEPPLRTP